MVLMEYSPFPGNGWLCYPNLEPKEYWLEQIQQPSEEEVIMFLNEKYCGHASVVTIKDTYNYILGFINNKK